MKQAFVLRNALIPYIYTNARNTYETGVSLVHPMYYANPNSQEAYSYKTQYMFGGDIIAAPITTVTNPQSHTVQKSIWLPSGVWVNWNGTQSHTGPTVVTNNYGVQDIPLFVRSGVVIPLQTAASVVSSFADPIMWTLFPGANSGSGHIYEDDGESLDYLNNKYATTNVAYTSSPSTITVNISPTSGSFTGMPTSRSHMVQVRDYNNHPSSVKVNGQTIPSGSGTPGWYISMSYNLDITLGALVISTEKIPVNTQISVEISK
jgi:alpha-glucosidase (family GH31 glycosyl hydrolase)